MSVLEALAVSWGMDFDEAFDSLLGAEALGLIEVWVEVVS